MRCAACDRPLNKAPLYIKHADGSKTPNDLCVICLDSVKCLEVLADEDGDQTETLELDWDYIQSRN